MNYEKYMKICIQLAKQAEGEVSPNPLVGCVIIDKDGNQISTGFHKKYGENHAERDALLKLNNGEERGGTLIVNLEPCSHYGKTPPCADLIIERGIKKVVIGMRDVNPLVAGNGIKKLKNAGIEVIEDVLKEDCQKLNEVFIKNMTKNKPFIAIKTATRYDAILTTSSTILADNPTMEHKKKLVLDRKLKTNLEANIYKSGEIYLFNDSLDMFEGGINFIKTPVKNEKLDMEFIIEKAWQLGIKSILVEAGGHFNGEIIKYADKIYHFIAPKLTCDNSSLSCFDSKKINSISECQNFKFSDIETFEPDILLTYYPC